MPSSKEMGHSGYLNSSHFLSPSYMPTNETSSGDAVSIIGTAYHYTHLSVSAISENVVSAEPARRPPGNVNGEQSLGRR